MEKRLIKDRRYVTVGRLIRTNQITLFEEILFIVPKTRIARDLRINPERFNRLIKHVGLFVIKDLCTLADLLEVDSIAVLHLINNQMVQQKNKSIKDIRVIGNFTSIS